MFRVARIGLVILGVAAVSSACRNTDAERRASAQATATAEGIAQLTTVTSATFDEARASDADAQRARAEIIAAFQLERADYRARLRSALDALDTALGRARQAGARRADTRAEELRARSLLREDLEAVGRCTEPDWATLRTKLDRDLERVAGSHAN